MPLSPHRPARKEPAAPEQGGSVPPIKITRVNLTASRFLSPSLWSRPAWPHMGHKHPHLQLAAGDREGQRQAAARTIRAGAGQVSSCDSEHPARPASVRRQRRSINQTPDTSRLENSQAGTPERRLPVESTAPAALGVQRAAPLGSHSGDPDASPSVTLTDGLSDGPGGNHLKINCPDNCLTLNFSL